MLRDIDPNAGQQRLIKREAATKAPKETTNGLLYIFPFLVRVRNCPEAVKAGEDHWDLQVIEIPAETQNEARYVLEQDPDVKIISAMTGRPHPDCFRERQIFDLKMAAAFVGLGYDTLSRKANHGGIAKSANGEPLFTRARLIHTFARAKNENEDGSIG